MQEIRTENPMLQMEHQTILRIQSLLPPPAQVSKTKWLPGTLVHSHFPRGFFLSSIFIPGLIGHTPQGTLCFGVISSNFSKFSLKGMWDLPPSVSPLSTL